MKQIKQTIVSEREAQLIYSRAFEVLLWGSPALAVMCQSEAGRRHFGAEHLDIIYTGKSMDYRWGGITYNNQSPYFINFFSLKYGPVVVEIPPDGRFYLSLIFH